MGFVVLTPILVLMATTANVSLLVVVLERRRPS